MVRSNTILPKQAAGRSSAAQQDRKERDWTILFYLCGDHGQWSKRIRQNLKDIGTIEPSEHMYIAVQHDLAKEDAKRFVIIDKHVAEADKIPVGEINTGDPNTALEFFRWAIKECPSKHVAIVFGGTGIAEPDSIVGNVDAVGDYEQLFAFCDDKSAQDAMNPVELGEIFSVLADDRKGKPIDLVAFDMCSMQYLEIAYQLKDKVEVMIASQNNEKAPEWSYAKLLKDCIDLLKPKAESPDSATQLSHDLSDLIKQLKVKGHADPNDPRVLAAIVVRAISDTYYKNHVRGLKPMVSALDLKHIDRVTRSLDTLFLTLMRSLGNDVSGKHATVLSRNC